MTAYVGRRPVTTMSAASLGQMANDPVKKKRDADRAHPNKGQAASLGVARVVNIDYEEHFVTLRTVIGEEQEFERVPVPMSWPGAGPRHFLGAMPEIGSYCVVGWMTQDGTSAGHSTMIPVILSWIMPGVMTGREWMATASFSEDEHSGASGSNLEMERGIFERARHKLRHFQPGNIVASSSQGSDLVLDEGVTLANRRGNELRLRDEDQALVLRTLQQFHAMAGARIYGGMVQRDGDRLLKQMVSDGLRWDDLNQVDESGPLSEYELSPDTVLTEGLLTPALVFQRLATESGGMGPAPTKVPEYLDPYVFLRNGGYIDSFGIAQGSNTLGDVVYGGKPLFRVAASSSSNAAANASARALTEYRIELSHTSDGRLPVTEQTDLFDADRLPPNSPEAAGAQNPNAAYIEWVLGSVVGNDPYSAAGRRQYGLPLVASVLTSTGDANPQVIAANMAPPGTTNKPTPLEEHAASLFRITPIGASLASTWWSVNKKGQLKASFGGKTGENSIEAAVLGDLALAVQGRLVLNLQGGIHFATKSKASLDLNSAEGPVRIYGGGPIQGAEGAMERLTASDGSGGQNLPSVDIEAKTSVRIKANKDVLVKGDSVRLQGSSVQVASSNNIEVNTPKRLSVSAEEASINTTGRRAESFAGPKNLLPTSGPLHDRTYTPSYPGLIAEKVTYQMGDRQEWFYLGNHVTQVIVGNLSYGTLIGTYTATAGASMFNLSPAGATTAVGVGNITMLASAGAVSITGVAAVDIRAVGPAALSSSSMVYLGAPVLGTDFGPILTAGSREPFTNLPFLTWGLGAKSHIIGV